MEGYDDKDDVRIGRRVLYGFSDEDLDELVQYGKERFGLDEDCDLDGMRDAYMMYGE